MAVFRARVLTRFATVATAMLGVAVHAQAEFTFHNVADTTTAGPAGTFASFGTVAVDDGLVAFSAWTGSTFSVLTGNGGPLTTIAKPGDSVPGTAMVFNTVAAPSIHGGVVAFRGQYDGTPPTKVGIFQSSGGVVSSVAKQGDAGPLGPWVSMAAPVSVDSAGVAFVGLDTKAGVFVGNGASLTEIVRRDDFAPGGGSFSAFSFANLSGSTVAFQALIGSERGIFTSDGTTDTAVVRLGDPAPVGVFDNLNANRALPNIDGGNVAFWGGFNGGQIGIFRKPVAGGPLTTIVQTGDVAPAGTFVDFGDDQTTVGLSGDDVVFVGIYAGGRGLFIADGTTTPTAIIKTGDPLFGSTVTNLILYPDGFDDEGDLAFRYSLADGREGVALTSVPEPAGGIVLGLAAAAVLARRRHR